MDELLTIVWYIKLCKANIFMIKQKKDRIVLFFLAFIKLWLINQFVFLIIKEFELKCETINYSNCLFNEISNINREILSMIQNLILTADKCALEYQYKLR